MEKMEETGRNGETEEKTRPKVKTMIYLLFTLLIFFNPFDLIFFGENMCFYENIFFRKTFFLNIFFRRIHVFLRKYIFFLENI